MSTKKQKRNSTNTPTPFIVIPKRGEIKFDSYPYYPENRQRRFWTRGVVCFYPDKQLAPDVEQHQVLSLEQLSILKNALKG